MPNCRNLPTLRLALLALPVVSPVESPVTVVHAGRLLDHAERLPRGPSALIIRDGHVQFDSDAGGEAALVERLTSSDPANAADAA